MMIVRRMNIKFCLLHAYDFIGSLPTLKRSASPAPRPPRARLFRIPLQGGQGAYAGDAPVFRQQIYMWNM